jgi:hypothetical protein
MGQKCDLHHKAKWWQPLDIELLKTFLEVRKTRHFGKAAENSSMLSLIVGSLLRCPITHLRSVNFGRAQRQYLAAAGGE